MFSLPLQNHSSVVATRFGPVLALDLPVYAIGMYLAVLHTGNQNAVYRPGEWNHFTVHPVGRLQPADTDSGIFGPSGPDHQCDLCQTHRMDSVRGKGQVLCLSQHRDWGTARLLHVRGYMYSYAVSFYNNINFDS